MEKSGFCERQEPDSFLRKWHELHTVILNAAILNGVME